MTTTRSSWGKRAAVAALTVAGLALPALATGGGAAGAVEEAQANAAAPSPTPARLNTPTSIAAIGDSITQATGTGALAQENPVNSWATGTGVNSVAARLGIPTNQRFNYAANGHRMSNFAPQVNNGKSGGSGSVAPMPSTTSLVLVEMGGNDLCKSNVASMTSIADYRTQLRAGLNAVAAKAPDALVFLMSVPDIYNLWYIRGAAQSATYHPEPESSQAGGINGARFYWGFDLFGAEFPCQSLLANPTSYDAPDRARREAVRQRTKDYNAVIAQECAKVVRCRTDANQLFNLTSNRVNPPDGPLLPFDQWAFTDLDISRNTATGCPIPGLVGGGCGDHFHPSKAGQEKIAKLAFESGFQFSDKVLPTAGATVLPSARPDGRLAGKATVRFTGSDSAGLKGQEVRVHRPDGSITAWTQHAGIAPDRLITDVGRSYVEVRSFDVNGNRSASVITPVDVEDALEPTPPTAPVVTSSATGLRVSWQPPLDDGGAGVARYDIEGLTGTPAAPFGDPVLVVSQLSATPPTPPPGSVARFTVRAVNVVGSSDPSPASKATVAPFADLAAFVTRQYRDLVGRAPTTAELIVAVDALDRGLETPAAMVERLRQNPWMDGAYGPATRLYRAYFLRLPDPSGLDFWANRRRTGTTLSRISQQFSVSSEFQRRYGSLTNAQFIDQIYRNVFGRNPDPSGRDFYLRRLASGWSRGQVVLQFSESSEYKRLTAGLVAVVQYERAMSGRAPSQTLIDQRLATYATDGAAGVFRAIISSSAYRTRVHS